VPHDYWDTSALAKLYLNERGSAWAVTRASTVQIVASRLVIVELSSVFARRHAEGTLSGALRDRLHERFMEDAQRYELVRLTDDILADAATMLLRGTFGTRVRAVDGVHLATAQWWFEQARILNIEPGAFVVADGALRDAVLAMGMRVENPEDHA
jgi:predicted nucleic acid-binding protein